MKMKRMAALFLGCVLSMTAAMPVMAATQVDAVYLSLIMEDELYQLAPGDSIVYTTPVEAGGAYYINETNITQNASNGITTYTLDIRADNGWYFNNNTMVSVYGAYGISVSLRTSTRMRVTAKAYPFSVLDEASGIVIDSADKKAYWSPIEGVKSYSVIIYYADKNGNLHHVKKSASGTSIDLKNYLDKYDYVDVAVRPTKGSTSKDRYTAEPNYINSSGGVDEENYVDVYKFRLPTSVYGTLPDGSMGTNPFDPNASDTGSGSSGTVFPGGNGPAASGPMNGGSPGNTQAGNGPITSTSPGIVQTYNGWQGSGNYWYYVVNGVRAVGWLSITPEEWYFLDNTGLMCAGWFNDGGDTYLLNPSHDGSYGRMLTGYQVYNGFLYYFNQTHDGTYGAMYKNRYTPDGRWADGAGVVR